MTNRNGKTNGQKGNPKALVRYVGDQLAAKATFLRGLLPREVTPDRMKAFAIDALRRDPKLLKCSQASILGAIYECAKSGLEPNAVEAVILPRWNSKANSYEAQFQIMYRGAMTLARRSGDVRQIWTGLARTNDQFNWAEGTSPYLVHKPAPSDRGAITHAYACARFTDGFVQFRVVDTEDIARAKKSSQTADKGFSPWKTDEGAMWRKTAVHRLCKVLPLPSAAHRALDVDEMATTEQGQDLSTAWEAIGSDSEQPQGGGRVSVIDIEEPEDDGEPEGPPDPPQEEDALEF